jgi:hypothetical protein
MLLSLLRHHPGILPAVWQVLGPQDFLRWLGDYAQFTVAAAEASGARAAGGRVESALTGLADLLAPAVSLRLRARYAEWRSMGWL